MSVSPEIEERNAQPYAAIAAHLRLDQIGEVLPELWPEVAGYLASSHITAAGAPFIRYVEINMEGICHVEVGIPTMGEVTPNNRIVSGSLPAGRYIVAVHTGSFDGLLESNAELQAWAAKQKQEFDIDAGVWAARMEFYLTDPEQSPDPGTWQTELAYKVRSQ